MQAFVAVVEAGSQTAAADKLGLSRPVISRLLSELEAWMGARLMHRTTRRLTLTDAGTQILPACRSMLGMASDMQALVAQPDDEPRGVLRITASTSFGQAQLARVLAAFVARHAQVKIDMVLLDRTVNLVDERLDLAIRITNDPDDQLIARRLTTCRSVVCASPAYLARHSRPMVIDDLPSHNCLTHSYHGSALWQFVEGKETRTVAVNGSISANDSVATLQAALCGAGVALLPTYLAAPHLRDASLINVLPDSRPIDLGIHAVYASRKHMSSALRRLLDFLVEQFPPTPAWDAGL